MVDAESIAARLERLQPLLGELERIRADGRDAYLGDLRTRLAADHAIQLAIQVCIDVGAHVISELGLPPPSDYRGVFASLRSAGLEADLAERLGAAAGMRNIIVHDYLQLDDEEVWRALDRLDDVRAFAAWATSLD